MTYRRSRSPGAFQRFLVFFALCLVSGIFGKAYAAVGDTLQGPIALKIGHSGKCLDIYHSNKDNFGKVQQYDCNGTTAQQFRLNDVGDGWFEIQNTNSNKCLDIKDKFGWAGGTIQQYDCYGPQAHNQHFKFDGQKLRSRQNQALCLDVADWSKANGAKIQTWNCGADQGNQSFAVQGGNGGGNGGDGNSGVGNNGKYVNIKVKNNCSMPLWTHIASAQGTLSPDNVRLGTGETRTWQSPNHAISGRVEVRRDPGQVDATEKVEYTFIGNPVVLNYNLTYVDFYGLPVSVESSGTGSDCKKATCDQPLSNFFAGCPAPLWDGQRCISPRTYCLDGRTANDPYCKKLDAKIAECADRFGDCAHARGASTAEAFACSGKLSEDPKNCAAINRNMLDDRESADKSRYYRNQPYNDYAKWSHEKCPNIYAFSFDDFPMNAGTSGFHACSDGSELSIVFCPKG